MAAASAQADCRGMYSWWWDSHISPKNSKWLYENLKDMDVKVKQMVRIIEEDADSFAKRAEMYYKRRPELMKLAEDFYRAYRALAERYGHATGVLRHARRTMAEAFPNKVKLNGRDFVKCGEDSDGFPPDISDCEITSGMVLPEEFMFPKSKSGFDELDGLFGLLGTEKSSFYSSSCNEGLERALTSTDEAEKEAAAVELEKSLVRLTGLESETARDAEIFKKQKELGRLWISEQEDRLERVDVKDSLQKLKNIWFQFQEETRSLFTQLGGKVWILEDAESRVEHLQEEIRKVQEENALQHLEMEISSESERLRKLEADSDQLGWILKELRSAGLDPENLVPSIKELNDKFTETKKTIERERSEYAVLQEKSASLDEFIEKNVLLEFSVFYLETQLEEFRDKFQFLKESCESLLEERLNATHERDSLASLSKETVDQNKKLKEMNRQLETSLCEANSQLRVLMMRAKGIKDYLQNTEKDYELLQSKYSVLETEKATLMSEIERLQIELKTKEACEEELEKLLDANINELFPNRDSHDVEERNSSLLFKLQTLAEAWKFSQVQISYLEHENLVQQSELQFLSDQIDIRNASPSAMSKWKAVSLEESVELDRDGTKNVIQKVHYWYESLSKIEEECLESAIEKSVLCSLLVQMKREVTEVVSDLNMSKIENLRLKNEITEVKSKNDQLRCEIICGNDLLCEKENRILKADKMLKAIDGEDKKIQRKLYNLKMELANAKLAKEVQEKQISRLAGDLNLQIVESGYLREEIKRMEHQLLEVNEEYRKNCRREEARANEVRVREAQATAFFCELIMSGLKETILEDRIIKVAEANGKESARRIVEIEQLREMVKRLDGENVELRSRVDAFMLEIKKVNTVSESKDRERGTGPVDDDKEKVADIMDFYEPAPQISIVQSEFTTKEIVIDQSFGFLHYADGRSLGVEADERMLELWETSDASGNIDLKVSEPLRGTRPDDSKFDEARKDLSVHNDEKELGTNKQELEHKQGASKRRLLERLNTDSQKLTNLHITLNDLQRMVEVIVRTGLERGGEYDAIKAELDEARATTAKLSQANSKLVKAVEKRFHSRPVRPTSEAADDGESFFIRRRISEKARRGSEKVSRLHSETQKLQILLLRLGEEKEDKARAAARVIDRKPRVLLKDYLNSRLRSSSSGHKQKKVKLCACVQLPSRRS